jgi:VCBS repeat-containing protein
VPEGAVVVPDPNLIFHGEYKRAGADLVVSHDGHEFVVHDYFRGDKRAAIASPDGAHLTGDIVNALTGHVQYAQAAGGIAAAQVIGHVTKLSGSATAVRNGVSVILNNGDNVEKGDVVSTGGDSTLGITFIDGTVFGLSSNARMVLNEMVYDPNGSNNSSLLSLVAGTITFVAGETAKHGDMKIDTPVATMGIRGTAVLNQINFVVPAGGGDPQPQVSFQVLVEPNGTTGSYILFDKVTLLPIATVNQAGQMIQISGGNVSITNALMSPDIQKLITDVFTLKFTDNGTNTKLTTNFTDTITQNGDIVFIKTDTGATATATFTNTVNTGSGTGQGGTDKGSDRIPGSPLASILDANGNVVTAFNVTEHAAATGDRADVTGALVPPDTIIFRVNFVDQNLGDRPTVSVNLDASKYTYTDSGHHDVTASLTALQKQDIAATQVQISVAADAGNNNNGSATLTYTVPDHAFDFLGAGETLTLTYMVSIANNFVVSPETTTIPITITITGTNDKPVITTSVPVITFEGGTSVPGGPLTSDVPTSGTLTFKDVDLTDTHTVSVALTSASLPDGTVPPGPLAAFQSAMSVAIAAGADSKGTGTGTINWSLADLPVYLADFVPKGEVLTLVYTVTVADEHGATSRQTITVTITGTDAPAVVWIATDKAGAPSGGFWKDAANWETGTVPTINDDVVVITDQLHGLTPSYPVTIDTAAYAKSITMNDFGGPPPEVINKSVLTIAGALNMSADSKFTNSAIGVMNVGGKAEILGTSVLTNAGYLMLQGGGDFASGTAITNSGMIELSGGTLKTLAEIHNAGGTLKADAGTTLIVDTATIDGGTVAILGTLELDGISLIENGTLNSSGAVNVKGTVEFAHETVSNTTSGTIKVLANGWLTIDHGSNVTNNGAVTVDASGKLTVNGATIDGAWHGVPSLSAATSDSSGGTDVISTTLSGIGTVTNGGELDLTGNAVLTSGFLKNNATLKVSGTGNALDYETVTNAGTIEVLAGGALAIDKGSTVANSSGNVIVDDAGALTLDHATISGGAVKGAGAIDVTGASKIDGGATVSISTITADAALTLDGVTVSGTEITDKSSVVIANTVMLKDGATIQGTSSSTKGAITNNGTLEIAGAATLLNDIVTNTSHVIKIDDGQTLTLSGTEISGGTINNYSGALGGTIDVTGDSKIGGNATLNQGAVTVESGYALTFGDATVAGTAIANHGTVNVDASKKLTLNGASLTGGALTVSGTLDSTGTSTVTNASITNNGLIEALGGLLTLAATTSASIANAGTLQANGAELDIDHEAVTNTGTLAAISNGTLKLIGMTVTNTVGTVSVESGSTLDLAGATIDGGTVTIAGTLESTGTSAINNADITVASTGTISVTSGTLTIDPATLHAITNHGLIQVSGAELDISGEDISNTADLKAINYGTLKLTNLTVSNSSTGAVSVDSHSKLYLTDVTINGGSLTNAGNLYSVGANTVTGGVTNAGTIEVQTGTLDLSGGITGIGTLIIDDTATLELGGADAQTVTFAGGTNTLKLDKTSHDFNGPITGTSSTGGTFNVTGAGNITTSKGDALDFTASGGTSDSHGNIVLTPTGALTGATNGIAVTQNGIGDISLTTVGDIKGLGGNGIVLHDGANGAGDITATIGGGVSGAVGLDVVSHGDGDVTITNNGHVTGATSVGINIDQDDAGATGSTHITNTGSVVGADGVAAISIQENATGTATITNSGTIGTDATVAVSATTYAIVETGGVITINNTGHIDGNISVATATFNNNAGGTWTVAGSGVFGDASSIVNHGDIDLHGASLSGTGLGIENDSNINSWGTASISGAITNAGTIEVHNGDLSLFGSLLGTGSVTVDVGALLTLEGSVTQTINLAGDGAKLQIDTSTFGGSIGELSATDTIDLSTIKFGLHTSAVYVANADAATGGVLTVTGDDGHTISLKLTGADYSHAHFAGTDDGTGSTLITINAHDDAPAFTAAGATLTGSVSEQANATGDFATLDTATPATGAIDFTDIDLTDLPTAQITGQVVTSLGADHGIDLTSSLTNGEIAALKNGLTLLPQTGLNNGTVSWSYSIADGKLDFLGQDQTAKIVSTITLTDDYGKTATTDVTITITGKNDAPTLAAVSTDPLVDTAVTDSFADVTGTLVGTDADHGETAGLHYAVLDGASAVTTLAGHYGSLTVNDNGTYDYVPDAAAINALSAGYYKDIFTVQTTDAHGATGTATFTVNVTGANDAPTLAAVNTDPLVDTAVTDSFADITGTLVGTDADTGETGTLHYAVLDGATAVTTLAGLYGSLTVNDNGTYDYVPDAAAINALSAGSYKDIFTVQTTDAHGAPGTATFTVNVTGANDAPTLAPVSTDPLVDTAVSDSFADITGTLVGTDADTGETGTLHYAVLDGATAVTTLAGLYGSLTVNDNGTYDYVPDAAAINALSAGSYKDIFTVQTTDAHGAPGTATFTVNVTGANDAPAITAEAGDSAGVSVSESNAGLDKTGTLTVSDADTADHVSVVLDHVTISLDGHLQADGVGGLTEANLLSYFTVPSGDILNGTANHGQFTWEFNSGSQAFDFLAAGQTLSLQYTIVPDDGHAATGTGNGVVTITIAGSNDSPTLDNTTLDPVAGNASDPSGAAISDLFANKFHDADASASFTAIAVTSDAATADQGVWQYEIAGTHQWVDIGSVSDTSALVLSTDTLIRFLPTDGFSGTPASLGVHALDDTYTGLISTDGSAATIDITSMSTDGTAPVSDKPTTIGTSVTASAGGPVIDTESFHVWHNTEHNTDTITGLSVVDTDSGASTDAFTITAVTAHDPDSSVDPGAASGYLDEINSTLADGVTYDPGQAPPDIDKITVTVTDTTNGLFDTVNFIFNESGDTSQGITLQGTSGKDVIFATDTNDTLAGAGGKDQFVFAPGSTSYDEQHNLVTDFSHTIGDFEIGLDKIDLRQFSDVTSFGNLIITPQSGDTLVTWQQQIRQTEGSPITEHESLLLKNVVGNLHASDFIFGTHIT